MYNKSFIYAVAVGAAMAVTTNASAEILSPTVVDFGFRSNNGTPLNFADDYDTVLTAGAYYGKANAYDAAASTTCPGGDCVVQNGMVIGTITDVSGPNAHLHQGGINADRMLAYHGDSAGVYIRTSDLTAFSLDSIYFDAPINGGNPYDFSDVTFFEVLGFSDALNPDLATIDPYVGVPYEIGTNNQDLANYNPFDTYSNLVAYQTVSNGTVGDVFLNDAFQNVSAVWIHMHGFTNTGSIALPFEVELDNIRVSPAAVPVPAAVWLFGTGLLGVLSAGRKKASKV